MSSPTTKISKPLEARLSETFAREMYAFLGSFPTPAIGDDVLLMEQQRLGDPKISRPTTKHGVVRFHGNNVLVYTVTQNEAVACGYGTVMYTYSPFYSATRKHDYHRRWFGFSDNNSTNGIGRFPYDPATNSRGESRAWKLHADGQMEHPRAPDLKLFSSWLAQFTPTKSIVSWDSDVELQLPSISSWYDLSNKKKEEAIDQLVRHVGRVFSGAGPLSRCRLRFNEGVPLPWPPSCADYWPDHPWANGRQPKRLSSYF